MKVLYQSPDRNSIIMHNEEADIYTIKTKKGVFYFQGEILESLKKDKDLSLAFLEKLLLKS